MHKVVTINLNGHAYQFDEDAYDAIRGYLDRAESRLRDNPDRIEILADLEQAIAEKCQRYLNPHKTVVALSEIAQVLDEMGPVESAAEGHDAQTDGTPQARNDPAARRLYRIQDGALIGGVCNGIAAFFGVDVTIVRVVFVLLGIAELASSHNGLVFVLYFAMMLIVPLASTSEEQAAAHGVRLNAQELIDRARRNFAALNDRGWWHQKREWRRQRREWKRHWRATGTGDPSWSAWGHPGPPVPDYGVRVAAGVMTSIFAVASLILFITFMYALISLLSTGGIYTWRLPANVPLWLATFTLFFTYYVVAWPLHMARRTSYYTLGGPLYGWDAGGYGLISAGLAVLLVWLAYQYVPEVREFIERLPTVWERIRHAFAESR